MGVNEHAVVVAGGGPTGLMLAAELTLAGVDVVVLERRERPDLESSRAGGLHARALEVLDQRGVVERFLEAGEAMQVAGFAMIPLDISDFPTRFPHGLALWQNRIDELLRGWAEELGVQVRRGVEVADLTQDEEHVEVTLGSGGVVRARYLVGCDGGRSTVRKAAGIAFPGWEASMSSLIAEARLAEEPEWGVVRRDAKGMHGFGRLDDGRARIILREDPDPAASPEPTLDDLRAALREIYGTDYGVHDATWISRFTDTTRQAESYRSGRVLLAGDAAHVHSPAGGQGLNTGVQDAVNLGWKLAQVVDGTSPDTLLDTYHAERHPVAARVLRLTMAMTALARADDRIDAVRECVADMLGMDEPRRRYAGALSGLDIHYDLGEGHLLLGRRMPDLDVTTADGPVRLSTLLHAARPYLLDLGARDELDLGPWAERVPRVTASYDGVWELPVLGPVTAPTAALVRPDGHVAWVGEGTGAGLHDALATWFGGAPVAAG